MLFRSLLRKWKKHPANPILLPPPGIGLKDFRDPLTAWFDHSDSTWRTLIGSKDNNGHAGIVLTYKTKDFVSYELMPGYMHRGPDGTGMYECIDLYPVGTADGHSMNQSEALYVLKESSDDDRHDYYALGSEELFPKDTKIFRSLEQQHDKSCMLIKLGDALLYTL